MAILQAWVQIPGLMNGILSQISLKNSKLRENKHQNGHFRDKFHFIGLGTSPPKMAFKRQIWTSQIAKFHFISVGTNPPDALFLQNHKKETALLPASKGIFL